MYLSGLGKEGISLGDNVSIGAYSRIVVSTSLNNIGKGIKIGNNVGIGEFAYLGGAGGQGRWSDGRRSVRAGCGSGIRNGEQFRSEPRALGHRGPFAGGAVQPVPEREPA